MKYLIVSDPHMENTILQNIISHEQDHVDTMFCLGDTSLKASDPLLAPFRLVVRGNHDYDDHFPYTITYNQILLAHGHTYKVYYGYDMLLKAAKENHCQIVLHGHTHVPTHQIIEGIHFINPGSVMINRGSYGFGTYAILETNPFAIHFYHHTTFEEVKPEILEEGLQTLEEFKKLTSAFEAHKLTR
ncbi:phosphoesterase [Intestinibaculum porci]|uniref:Phosphoesterase n=1 Tax=Intestinibaculum porci TaxID=2487118 RepID=A0A3G9JQL5_9FIRM|nr:YfcE family phosphodiesterase [Intestinibaculum porci]BBH26558.1 phosphoesterase [Intestinibaculum porci]